MSSGSHKVTYIWSMCIGGVGGLLFLACFFIMFGNPIFFDNPLFQRLNDFVSFVSLPVFYLLGDKLSATSIMLGISLFILYWVILGMAITCWLVWVYFFISSKRRTIVKSSGKTDNRNK